MLASGSLTGLFYVLHILSRTVGPLKWMGNLSIFYYYEPAPIASELSMNWTGIGIYLSIIVVCFAASIYVFERRDIVK
jgi:ABC-type transport system involved in multi-copper enzyme maturation permease subunit